MGLTYMQGGYYWVRTSENAVKAEVRRMPGSVTEPIQEPPRPLTLLADNARKPLGEVEDPLRLHNTSGASFARYILPRSWLCPDPMAHGNSQALLTTEP